MLSRSVITSRSYFSHKQINRSLSSSSRPVAKFDENLEEIVNTSKISKDRKSNRLTGVFDRRPVQLPRLLKEAVDNIIKKTSDGNLFENAKNLNDHLVFKKPPLTSSKLKEIESQCTQKVLTKFPPLGNYS